MCLKSYYASVFHLISINLSLCLWEGRAPRSRENTEDSQPACSWVHLPFLMFLGKRWSLYYRSDLATITLWLLEDSDSVTHCVIFLMKLRFHWRVGILNPHPFKTPLFQASGFATGCRTAGPQASQGQPQKSRMSLGRWWTATFLLCLHFPDDSPETLRSLQSKDQLHNFSKEKVTALLENADQRKVAFRKEGFHVI